MSGQTTTVCLAIDSFYKAAFVGEEKDTNKEEEVVGLQLMIILSMINRETNSFIVIPKIKNYTLSPSTQVPKNWQHDLKFILHSKKIEMQN